MADASFRPPRLGVGMVFAPALRPFLERRPDALDLLEVEPQTLWIADDPFAGPFFEFTPGIEMIAALPGAKLVHSVGMPLGGTRAPEPAQMRLIRATAERLGSPWVSEHLSVAGTPHRAAGFLLPPVQTEAGVAQAAANIRAFAEGVGRPVAVETGVAYLRRKPFEMHDGDFLAAVAEEADCGLLLDLHNLWCNEVNGRVPMDEVLARVPLDRVWEVHLAGGEARDGFWLDSHSGPMPAALADRAAEILGSLPDLGALNFEIYDSFLDDLAPGEFDRIVDSLRDLWEGAGRARSDAPPICSAARHPEVPPTAPEAWEEGLTDAVWQDRPERHGWAEDAPALHLYAELARSFRGSMLVRTLPRTIRYLLLRDGAGMTARLERFFTDRPPRLYAPLEAASFADWLRSEGEDDALALALLDYDSAFLAILRHGEARVVRFPGDPAPVFEALAANRLPRCPDGPPWDIEILPDGFTVQDFAASAASFAPRA